MKIVISCVKIISVNLLVFLLIFLTLEVVARVFFPHFIGHIHSPATTLGKNVVGLNYLGLSVRVPYPDCTLNEEKDHIIILGDSITGGYGLAYEDIYWVNLQRLLNLFFADDGFQIAAYGDPGRNIHDILAALKKISNKDIKIHAVIYQFNFNDIMPYRSEDLKAGLSQKRNRIKAAAIHNNQTISAFKTFWKRFNVIRVTYLNHSAAIRMLWHYAETVRRQTSGTCSERGVDALESYTWSFGSENFKEESNALWVDFEKNLIEMKKITEGLDAKFYILVSPTIFHIDTQQKHFQYNHLNLDFSCATIDPMKKLEEMSEIYNIEFINPIEYMRTGFENRIKEGNFQPFYFTADHNHFNETGSKYVSEYILSKILPGLIQKR